jgi:hypothetical protein
VILLSAAMESQAASARVRCFVENGDRLRIKVDGLDLAKGTYKARVKNLKTAALVFTAPTKYQTVTIAGDDIDLDFDSTAQANDKDTFVSFGFAKVGETVRGSVIKTSTNVTVASASISCVAK